MASIYKPSNRKHFHTSFHIPTGANTSKKVTRSTGETNRKKAQHTADALERAALDEVSANSERSRSIMEIITQAQRDALKGTLNAVSGKEYIRQIVKISTGKDAPEYTIGEWVAEWLERKEGKTESTMQAYRTHTAHFLKWLEDRTTNTLESLTVADMRTYRKWLLAGAGGKRKASATTAKLKMKVVSSIYIKAMAEGLTNFNPTAALEPLDEGEKLGKKTFTLDEIGKLIASASTVEWKGIITMGTFTGLRLIDCALIEWQDINLKKELIETTPRKTKRKKTVVTIPIHPSLLVYLKERPTPINPATKVFPTLSKLTGAGRNGLSMKFTRIMKNAGVSRGESKDMGGRTIYERSFHSLRHTLTSLLADSNVSPEVRMQILGHKSEDVHAIYTHLDNATLKAAMGGVPEL
jgi:integrase/recombinase XerD